MNIAINGFGRIGRTFLRTILSDEHTRKQLKVRVINVGPANIELIAHMFKYDTIMGTYPGNIAMKGTTLWIDDYPIEIVSTLQDFNWHSFSIDWVVDASGNFTKREQAALHLKAGAKHVLITAPASDEDSSIIPGINHHTFNEKEHAIVSLGSCTTNALLPLLKVLHENFGITQGFMTTVHAYTNTQKLLDVEAKNVRLARAAGLNIIPTATGASKMIAKILPELEGKIQANALRIPLAIVSLIDLTVLVQRPTAVRDVNNTFMAASMKELRGILAISEEELVSSDYRGNAHSVIVDAVSTQVNGNLIKVLGWYDNEWGYSQRLKDFLMFVAKD